MDRVKTTVGKLLAENLNLSFFDADDFHPITNKDKMSEGTPLSDEDRFPWIATLNALLLKNRGEGLVLACSALKELYRKKLTKGIATNWIYLKGNYELIDQRLSQRSNHFMPQGAAQIPIPRPGSSGLRPNSRCCAAFRFNCRKNN